jgi:hypothetical protein
MGPTKRQSIRDKRSNKSAKRTHHDKVSGTNRRGNKKGEDKDETEVEEDIDVTPSPLPTKKRKQGPDGN